MDEQWPPAPVRAGRTVMIGTLRMEIDADRMVVTKPYVGRLRRRIEAAAAVIATPAILGIAAQLLQVNALNTLPLWMSAAYDVSYSMLPIACLMILVGFFFSTKAFVLRRDPNSAQIGDAGEHTLPGSTQVIVESWSPTKSPVYLLKLALPGEDGAEPPQLRLATFVSRADAELAKAEIEDFWAGTETGAE